MPIEFTTEQLEFLALLVGLLVFIFQGLKRLAAFPFIYRILQAIYAKFTWLPGNSDTWQRITLGALAIVVTALFRPLVLPAFPEGAAEFTFAYAAALLTWATNVLAAATVDVAYAHAVFHFMAKPILKLAAKAEIPVVKELAPAAIKAAVAEAKV